MRGHDKNTKYRKALKAAFPHTIPIFAGSVEFVAVDMLLGPFVPFRALVMTLMINARHLFYRISMLDRYKGMGMLLVQVLF